VFKYGIAGNPLLKPPGYDGPQTFYEFLATVRSAGPHGMAFSYKTPNTDVLGWIVARTANQSVPSLLAERIWSRMGAEQDAFFTVDPIGTPFVGGGFNCGLRDMARLGQILLDDGTFNGQQLVPAAAIRRIRRGGDQAAFAKAGYETLSGASYRSMWWILHNRHGAFAARGVHGQAIYIDPTAHMVIARFASHPTAFNATIDPTTLPAFQALAEYLVGKDQK
jgi:CubicO group peptidase (beta-lactamase class C family)